MFSMNNQISNYSISHALFQALIYFLLIEINFSAPINSSLTYANFLKEIQHDNCKFPEQLALPFKSSAYFEYLGVHIKICSPTEEQKSKRSREAVNLCSDIFSILKNITCHPDTKVQLPEIKVEFSKKVCADISSIKFSPETKTLLKHLTDSFVCDMMCDEEFNPACQVLLWSYQVQQEINKAAVELKKNKGKETVVNGNVEAANVEGEQKESITIDANKDKVNSENVGSSQITSPSDTKILPEEIIEQSNDLVPSNNNNTNNTKENLNNAQVETINQSEKSKTQKPDIPAKPSSVNDVDNQVKINLLAKEKDVAHQIPTLDANIKIDKDNPNLVNVDESPAKSNAIQTDNPKKTSTLNKTKQIDINDNKPVPEKAGLVLVDESESKIQNPVTSEKLSVTATNSNKGETKMKSQTGANIELTSDVGKTVSETKDLKVTPEKTKDTIVSNLKTEVEKTAVVEVANQNTVSESFTGETSILEEVSPITTSANLEKMEDGNEIPEPSDKNQEPYNDMENEGDYSKLDYDDADDGFYDSSKNKKTDLVEDNKIPVIESQNELPKYDVYHSRNSVGRGVEDIQVIPAFPEQEDSHFFFYFLSIVIFLMGGYLVFHNKQKIIALIVEGRHERRRRSHGVGYKKLETK